MKIVRKIAQRIPEECRRAVDSAATLRIRMSANAWPCSKLQYLVVGCESSGTSILSLLLFEDTSLRFLREGEEMWVWDAYMSIFQGNRTIRDYPKLQLYDAIKVPGFASILADYIEGFPNTKVVYIIRDPRDMVTSACKTNKVTPENGLKSISWVQEDWLGIDEQDPVARLAHRWRIYLEQSLQVPGVVYVRYEDFCKDKVKCIMELASTLGIESDEARVRSLCDKQASLPWHRNYRPAGPGAWRDGPLREKDLKCIEEICSNHMRDWQYSQQFS